MPTSTHDLITEARIRRLLKDAAGTPTGLFLWDTQQRGFGLRASPVNRKGQQKASWIVQRWSPKLNRMERVVFAEFPDMGVAAARKEAERRRGGDEGLVDPKKAAIAAAKIALGEVVERYLAEAPLLKKKPLSPRYWKETRQMLERELVAKLGKNKSLPSIDLQDVRKLIKGKQVAGQHAMARSLYLTLSPFFKWCVFEGLLKASPLANYLDAPTAVDDRERELTDADLKALWNATEADSTWNRYFRLLLLTGQRREEVASLRRSELDLDQGIWTIPKERTKNGKDHIVHLSPQAVAVIEACTAEGDYLFPATPMTDAEGKPIALKKPTISGFSKAKSALDKRMGKGVAEWRVHDLRRTVATRLGDAGFATSIVERVLNHISGTQGGLVGRYQKQQSLEERKRALEWWGREVERIVSDKPLADNVHHLRGAGVA